MNITYATNGHEIHVTYTLTAEPEDMDPNESFEREVDAQRALARLRQGNEWGWCCAKVTASITVDGETFTGSDQLGGCSYESEAAFRADPYFANMCKAAFADLKTRLEETARYGATAARALEALA